jgi:hypothetical protein
VDDVHVLFLILTGVPNFTSRECVEFLDRRFGDRQLRACLMNKLERVAVTAHFFLIPVT